MDKNKNWTPNNPRIKNSCYKGYIALDTHELSVRELKRLFIKKHGLDGKILTDILNGYNMWDIKEFYKLHTYAALEEAIEYLSYCNSEFDADYRTAKLKYIESL